MDQSLQFLPRRSDTAAGNMATDQCLLDLAEQMESVRFRHYDWTGPAFTFGRLQRWTEVARLAATLIEAGCTGVRRPSGGGLVDHRADWTYALVVPPASHWFRSPAIVLYRLVHHALAEALGAVGVAASVHEGQPDSRRSGSCFARPEQLDLVRPDTDEKLGGAALRRSRSGLLLQGSICSIEFQGPGTLRSKLASAAAEALARRLDLPIKTPSFPTLPDAAYRLLVERFQSTHWNRNR